MRKSLALRRPAEVDLITARLRVAPYLLRDTPEIVSVLIRTSETTEIGQRLIRVKGEPSPPAPQLIATSTKCCW
jgi:hypothetical protein